MKTLAESSTIKQADQLIRKLSENSVRALVFLMQTMLEQQEKENTENISKNLRKRTGLAKSKFVLPEDFDQFFYQDDRRIETMFIGEE